SVFRDTRPRERDYESRHQPSKGASRADRQRGDDRAAASSMPGTRSADAEQPATQLATGVQTVTVTGDEAGMRVDRFLEGRFPGLSFSHIKGVIGKGELRVNGKGVDGKDRLVAGQAVRIPPLKLDRPKPVGSEADEKTRSFLASITLYEDDDVLVLNKPM